MEPGSQPSFGARRYIKQLSIDAIEQNRPIAFDTSALIPFLERRPRYGPLLLPLFGQFGPRATISSVALAELLVVPARDGGATRVEITRRAVLNLPRIVTVPLDDVAAGRTALVRARTGLKFPDAAVLAAALSMDAIAIIGNDRRWKNRDLGVPYHHLDDILALA